MSKQPWAMKHPLEKCVTILMHLLLGVKELFLIVSWVFVCGRRRHLAKFLCGHYLSPDSFVKGYSVMYYARFSSQCPWHLFVHNTTLEKEKQKQNVHNWILLYGFLQCWALIQSRLIFKYSCMILKLLWLNYPSSILTLFQIF